MAAVIGALRAILSANLVEWDKGLQKGSKSLGAFGKKVGRFGRSMAKVGAGITAVTAVPLVAFAKSSLTAFQQQEDAIAAVESGLKSMGDASGFTSKQLQAMASDMQKLSTFGDEDIMRKVTAQLLTFGNISGDVFKQTQQLALDLSAKLGTDLQSSAIQLGKALNDPATGLSMLTRIGITFTDQQKDMIKTMQSAGDMAGAQGVILEELQRQYGGTAEALSKTTSGALQQATMRWGDFQERIGELVAKFLPPLLSLLDRVLTFLEGLTDEQIKWGASFAVGAAAIGPVVVALGLFLAALGPIITAVATVGGAIGALAAGPLALILTAIAAVVLAWKNWETIGPIVDTVMASLQEKVNGVLFPILDSMKAKVEGVLNDFKGWQHIPAIAKAVYEGIKLWMMDKLSAVWDAVKGKIDQAVGWFRNMKNVLVGNSIVPDMVDGIEAEFDRLDNVMVTPAQNAANAVEGAFSALGGKLDELFDEFVETGKISFDTLKRMALDLAKQLFVTPFLTNITSGVQGLFGGGATGGGLLGSLFGGFRAQGGPVTPNKSFLVGEQGPELFRPSTAGDILPGGFGGGDTINHWNITTPDSDSFRHSTRQISREVKQRFAT